MIPKTNVLRLKAAIPALVYAAVGLGSVWTVQAAACTIASPSSPDPDVGTFSPAAIKAGVVPTGRVSGGMNCSGTVISLLGGNVLNGTLGSPNAYQMLPVAGGEPVTFKVYLDQAATKQLSTTATTNFLGPQLIDLIGLLGNSPSDIPLYVKVSSTNPVPTGSYVGTFTMAWVYKFCSGVWVGSTCTLGTAKQGSGTATIKFTLTVTGKPVTTVITSITTWDPLSGTYQPRDLPSSKRRTTITMTNPDIVPIDAASLIIDLPTPSKTTVALDGDGTGGQAIRTTATGSGLSLTYTSPSATSDNVEFSSNDGATFSYAPIAGNPASQAAVTTVRFRPQGSMAPGSSFTVSLPYSLN